MKSHDWFRYIALACMAFAVVLGAITANAPAAFLFLWELKAATGAFTGLAGLFLNFLKPDGSSLPVPVVQMELRPVSSGSPASAPPGNT